jgi:type II secretion system protein N
MGRTIFSLRFFLYLLYGLGLTAVLLYVRFPTEKFRQFCEKRIERYLPGITCEINKVVYRFPLSAVLAQVKLTAREEEDQAGLGIKELVVTARPKTLFNGYLLDADILGGTLIAELDLDGQDNTFQLNNIALQNLDLGAVAGSLGDIEREMSGVLEYAGSYQADSNHPLHGSGKGLVKVGKGSMTLLQPVLGLSAIDFESVAMNVTQENGVVGLSEGKMNGQDIVADFTGELRVVAPLGNSILLLSGQMEPQDDFLRSNPREQQVVQRLLNRYKMTALPFKVGGTVKRPLFRFSK